MMGAGCRHTTGTKDPSLVSVVRPSGQQQLFWLDLRLQVRRDTQKSTSVRGGCNSVSHSAVVRVTAPAIGHTFADQDRVAERSECLYDDLPD